MRYGRKVDDYMDLYEKGLPKSAPPERRCGSARIVLTENTYDDHGPIQHDVLYLAHYVRVGFKMNVVQVCYRLNEGWVRIPNSQLTSATIFRLTGVLCQRFNAMLEREVRA